MNELGELLKSLRGKRPLREIADITNLSHTYISDIEKGYRRGSKKPIHPSPDTLKRLASAYNYPYEDLMNRAGYLESKAEEFIEGRHTDIAKRNEKDKRDIAKKLESILGELDSNNALAFDGEPMDENTRELVRAQIESNLRVAKQMARKKFTPKQYRKEDSE